jgi:hypothetical protein
MTVTASGMVSVPVSALRDMLSQSATFQTWTGTASSAAALAYIHMIGLAEADRVRPFALITLGDNWRRTYGGSNRFIPSGELFLVLESDIDEDNVEDFADSELEFSNNVGGVIGDLEALTESGALVIQTIRMQVPPERTWRDEKQSEGDYYQCVIAVDYGFGGGG